MHMASDTVNTAASTERGSVHVEFWGDVVCPFCYMGYTQLMEAAKQSDLEISVKFRSFQLAPDLEGNSDKTDLDLMTESYGISRSQAIAMNNGVSARAAEIGLTCNLNTAIAANSLNAHRLIHFAETFGKHHEMAERLFRAYQTDNIDLSDYEALVMTATELGFTRDEVMGVLNSDAFVASVRSDRDRAQALGIRSVPFFVVNGQLAVSGAQPVQALLELFQQAGNTPTLSTDNADTAPTRVIPGLPRTQ